MFNIRQSLLLSHTLTKWDNCSKVLFMTRIVGFVTFLALAVTAYTVPPVLNYAGQVAVNGETFDGNRLFKFALVNADGTITYWSNDGTSVDGSDYTCMDCVGVFAMMVGASASYLIAHYGGYAMSFGFALPLILISLLVVAYLYFSIESDGHWAGLNVQEKVKE